MQYLFLSTYGLCDSFIVLGRLAALASGSRSGVRRTMVTPEKILPFVYICVYVYACLQCCVVVAVVGRPRYMRFVFSLCHYRLVLLPSRIFPLPARSAIPLFSFRSPLPAALFCVKPPPRGTHTAGTTTKRRDGTYGGPQG